MLDNKNIIAIRKKDFNLAHQAFSELMSKTECILNNEAKAAPTNYRQLTPSELEICAVKKIQDACNGTPFNPKEVLLISGHRFPDIVAEKYYGIEVKSTKENHWTSTGSSIVESTRVKDIDDLYMLFGKLGGNTPQFKCRPYQDVLYDIAVTHSPRYLINMELDEDDTIFSKMGITYDEFRKSEDSIAKVRHYYRQCAIKNKRQEMPWWITSDNIETPHSFNIKLWNTLDIHRKHELQTKCMILFPEALNPIRNMSKYNNITLWLCSYCQVINPNIRDLYSAGGKITHVNGKRLKTPVAQVFNIIVQYSNDIKTLLDNPTTELLQLIAEYNPLLLKQRNLFENWVNMCNGFAAKFDIPLKEWIEEKPIFSFSK